MSFRSSLQHPILMRLLVACAFFSLLVMSGCADDGTSNVTTPGTQDSGSTDVGFSDVAAPDTAPTPTCDDGTQNGQETDIDCGGPACAACDLGQGCAEAADCESDVCQGGVCVSASCDDGVQNGSESDTDCGGSECGPCPTGSQCQEGSDCASGRCTDDICAIPTCEEAACGQDACYRGQCYPACENSSECTGGARCYEGHCAPTSCAGIVCDAGESCFEGLCYADCGDGSGPCPQVDVTTDEVTDITETSATVRATLIERSVQGTWEQGFCWSLEADASRSNGSCFSLGEAGAPGVFVYTINALLPGHAYYVRAYLSDGTDTHYANELTFETGAHAPTLTASLGTIVEHVELEWPAVEYATGYVLRRDEQIIATLLSDVTSYLDTEAGAADEIAAPQNFTATAGDHHDRVELQWDAVLAQDNAPTHAYTLTAVFPSTNSPRSAPADGRRAYLPVTGYEVEIDGQWLEVGDVQTHTDDTAPMGSITTGTVTASQGDFTDRVALELVGYSPDQGQPVTYRVRALTEAAPGADSEPATGYRGVGEIQFQWERSQGDSDSGYTDLPGDITATRDDTTAPADGSAHYYRVYLSAAGAESLHSPAARGFRGVPAAVATLPVSDVSETTAVFHGDLTNRGVPVVSAHGFCWGLAADPGLNGINGAECEDLGAPGQTGAFSTVATLQSGTTYYVRAFAGSTYGANQTFTTLPGAPTGVTASDGLFSDHVAVSWNAVTGATSYRVLRDGNLVSTVVTTSVEDTQAALPARPSAPTLTASNDEVDHVALTWNAATITNGAAHSYTVVAVNATGPGPASAADTGYRGAYPVTRYEVQIDNGAWNSVGLSFAHNDATAPAPTLQTGTVTASQGEFEDRIVVSLAGAGAAPGATVSYRVRAQDSQGAGAASTLESGNRSVGATSIQWQRSAGDSDGGYANINGATETAYTDTNVSDQNQAYYYRAQVSATGAGSDFSAPVRGFISSFSNATFTHCGQTGRTGPTQAQCNGAYVGTDIEGEVTVTGGIQRWVVPSTAVYRIEALGARGGGVGHGTPGNGASMRGDFALTAGDVLQIAVGQQGVTGGQGGGGGGGTFVLRNGQPLIIAGGGGGSHYNNNSTGLPGHTGPNGTTNASTGTGYTAGSGASFASNGANGDYNAEGGKSWANGMLGGVRHTQNASHWSNGDGGFGGGGGGCWAPGSGGGYGGGISATSYGNATPGGGGGGSLNTGSNQSNTTGVNAGHGSVTIVRN